MSKQTAQGAGAANVGRGTKRTGEEASAGEECVSRLGGVRLRFCSARSSTGACGTSEATPSRCSRPVGAGETTVVEDGSGGSGDAHALVAVSGCGGGKQMEDGRQCSASSSPCATSAGALGKVVLHDSGPCWFCMRHSSHEKSMEPWTGSWASAVRGEMIPSRSPCEKVGCHKLAIANERREDGDAPMQYENGGKQLAAGWVVSVCWWLNCTAGGYADVGLRFLGLGPWLQPFILCLNTTRMPGHLGAQAACSGPGGS